MTTFEIDKEIKEATKRAEAKTRATFIANRKEVMIKQWWEDFSAEGDVSFDDLHANWVIQANFGILSQPYVIPSIEDCCDAVNDMACKWDRFNEFFQENLKRK